MHKPLRSLVSAAVAGILATGAAQAGGFALYTEGNGSTSGNFGAGVAAEAADASTGWYNPAGLALIHNQQAVFAGVGVFPTSGLSGTSTFTTTVGQTTIPTYSQSFTGLNGSVSAFVPSFHYALPIGENATFGLSVVSPFGLSTDWGPGSAVRYQSTFTELLTSNISPEIGGKLSENFAVGAGLDLQYARVKFNRILGAPTILNFLLPPVNPIIVDSLSYNKGTSYGVGFHAGVMGIFNDKHTRVGLNYQSKMRHTFHGYSELTGRMANTFNLFAPLPGPGVFRSNNLSSNPIELPDVVTLSGYHDLNEKIAFLASVVYTGWSSFKVIQLNNVAAPGINVTGLGNVNPVLVNSTSPQNYSDAWRFALGANYHVNQKLMLRVGGGFDGTPTNDVDRDVRLPDADRWALSVGAHYQARPDIGVDLGLTRLFAAENALINRTDALGSSSTYNVTASASASAYLLGAQLVWTIDKKDEAPTK